jgi:hypothetical protein
MRAAVFTGLVAVAAGGAVLSTRMYQGRSAAQLFERYQAAPRAPLAAAELDAGPDRMRLAAPEWLGRLPLGSARIETRFVAVQFRDRECSSDALPLTIRYEATLPELDFSEPIVVQLHRESASPTTLFFAAFDRPDDTSRFRGIEVARQQSSCLAGIFDVTGIKEEPLLLTTRLGADWRSGPLYQRLR